MADLSLECPFCAAAFREEQLYSLQLHIEEVHTDDSPFKVTDADAIVIPDEEGASAEDDFQDQYVECPEAECGESVLLLDYDDHLSYHEAENNDFDHASSSSRQHASHDMNSSSQPSLLADHQVYRHSGKHAASVAHSVSHRSILAFHPPKRSSFPPRVKSARLGRRELGPYAYEERMPKWLEKRLTDGARVSVINKIGGDGRLIKQEVIENETPGVVPVLAQLSHIDRGVREAWYCHPSTVHMVHTKGEGGFCGYRNTQMLVSYIQGARAEGHADFPGRTPTIIRLQELIEEAWNRGINEIARIQTGGISKTRKWIGTPEVQAIFTLLQIGNTVKVFSEGSSNEASSCEKLFAFVEGYFAQATKDLEAKVHRTYAPPIYLQHPGHSLTIVGFERRKDGSGNLIVFDPQFKTSPAMHRLLGRNNIGSARPEVIDAYRRDERKLRRHRDFELLMQVMANYPAHRFVYVFLRAASMLRGAYPGYDVYPEHYFLPMFPWQNFGGLFIVDEGRFARSPPIVTNALTIAQYHAGSAGMLESPTSSLPYGFSPIAPISPPSSFGYGSFPSSPVKSEYEYAGIDSQLLTPPSSPPSAMSSMSPMGAAGGEYTGLFPVRILSNAEMQVVLFWQCCGRPDCTFGCGKGKQGEAEASRRLFRPEEVVE